MDIMVFKFWICLVVILSTTYFCSARIGFVKDQSTDKIHFPPVIKKVQSGLPAGHLRPFGWHRSPDGKVPEESGMLNPQDFFTKYVNESKPVVFRGAISDVPAMTTWQKDEYLKRTYGHLEVHSMVKKELYDRGIKKTTMKHFLKEYNFEDWYLSNIIPKEMMHELTLPKCLKCDFMKVLQESEIWMSSGGTVSLVHSHADHNLHCVMAGRKDFILIHPKYREKAYYTPKPPHEGNGYCDIGGMERLNMFKYPTLAEIPWTWSTLTAGDCMFIPAVYLHQVRSYGRSFSSTILWAPSPELDFSECQDHELERDLTLDQAPFIWAYLHADRELSNRKLDDVSMREHLLVWMRNETGLRYDIFKNYYNEIMSEMPKKDIPDCRRIWKGITGGDPAKRVVLRADIKTLNEDNLTQLAQVLNRAHEYHGHKPEQAASDELHDEL